MREEELKDIEPENNKDGEESNAHPFDPENIKITNAVYSLSTIVERLNHDEIDLNPDFQRNAGLWDRGKMSRLIESMILRLPLPIFYFDIENSNRWIVIDGLQRLSAIKQFIGKNKFALKDLDFLKDIEGKTFDKLDRNIQRTINETQIYANQVEPKTPKNVKYSIFKRINTGGLVLNKQEIRQALNQNGNAIKFLETVIKDDAFKRIVSIKSKRMVDRELVLRFIAFTIIDYKDFCNYKKTISTLLDETMEKIDKEDMSMDILNTKYKDKLIESLLSLEKIFDKKMLFNKTLVDETKNKTLNRSLFEIWMVLLGRLDQNQQNILIKKKNNLISEYKKLLKTKKFDDSITIQTNSRESVKYRFQTLEKLLKDTINED